jgi:hypothetical protein
MEMAVLRDRAMCTFVVFALVMLLAGCSASLDQKLKKYAGRSIDEVVERRGDPDEVTRLHNGGSIVTWKQRWGAYGENICTVRFTCDASGIVQSYSYLNCGLDGSGQGP